MYINWELYYSYNGITLKVVKIKNSYEVNNI